MIKPISMFVVASALLAGCASSGDEAVLDRPATQETQAGDAFSTGADSIAAQQEAQRLEAERAAAAAAAAARQAHQAALSERTMYFDFDSAELRTRERDIIRAHGGDVTLMNNKDVGLTVLIALPFSEKTE